MTPNRHRIPQKVFLALAAGGGGAHAIGHLQAAQYSKRLLLVRGVRDAVIAMRHPSERQVRQAYSLLAQIQGHAPEVVNSVLRYPSVGAWARRTLLAMEAGTEADPGWLSAVAATAAIRAGHPGTIGITTSQGAVVLPSLGRAVVPGAAHAVVRCGPGPAEITAQDRRIRLPDGSRHDMPGWEAIQRVDAEYLGMGIHLLLDDIDPHRMPGVSVAEDRLTPRQLDDWRATMRRAWRLLVRQHWTTGEEIAAAVTVLTPMAEDGEGHASATSYQSIGAIGLTTPPDDHFLAVTLAHETQHTKLAALIDMIRLTLPDDGRRYYAPWRDDPRPILGLLHGVYAHLAIAGYWRRQRHQEQGQAALRAHREFARWRDAATLAARTLAASGRLSVAGARFVTEMTRTLLSWQREPVPREAMDQARESAERHRDRWRTRNGEPSPGQADF
jgi:HEXXH motif-containing protein